MGHPYWSFIWVGIGGALGALVRHGIGTAVPARWPTPFPLATFLINVSGSLLLGLVVGLGGRAGGLPSPLYLGLATGFLGAYTTFSSLSVETLRLWQAGSPGLSLANGIGSLVVGLLAAWLGMRLAR